VAVSLGVSAALAVATGGQEVADDAPHFLEFVRSPLVLWGDYSASGISDRWGSFPPLLPLLFSALIGPWTVVLPDFWALRLGVLCWTLVAFALLGTSLTQRGFPRPRRSEALWLFALLPSVWGAIALNPQDEVYVSIFALLLYRAAIDERWGRIPLLLALTALAGKYFVLILALPLALASPRPLRNLGVFVGASFVPLGAYLLYHQVVHGLTPVASYVLEPSASTSIWGLLWTVGFRAPPALLQQASVLLTGGLVMGASLFARRARLPLEFSMSISLLITVVVLSISVPGYVLWSVPLVLVSLASVGASRTRAFGGLMLFTWGVGEWGVNFARGVAHNLATRSGGKAEFVESVRSVLGTDLPLHALHVGFLLLVLLSAGALIVLLWRESRVAASGTGSP
jgi:hypothetical protein